MEILPDNIVEVAALGAEWVPSGVILTRVRLATGRTDSATVARVLARAVREKRLEYRVTTDGVVQSEYRAAQPAVEVVTPA